MTSASPLAFCVGKMTVKSFTVVVTDKIEMHISIPRLPRFKSVLTAC